MQQQIKWQNVESSNVESLAYDESSMTLAVKFIGGSIYTYDGVGEQVFSSLANSESVGRYLNQAIKGSYPYLKHDSEVSMIDHIQARRKHT